jgi:hypothetical protein
LRSSARRVTDLTASFGERLSARRSCGAAAAASLLRLSTLGECS